MTRFLDALRLLRDVWAVACGRATRIARPGKWRVYRNGRHFVVELLP